MDELNKEEIIKKMIENIDQKDLQEEAFGDTYYIYNSVIDFNQEMLLPGDILLFPKVQIDKKLESIQFVVAKSLDDIVCKKSLFIDSKMIKEGIQIHKKYKPNMHDYVRMCASSEILETQDSMNNKFKS